jgi:hypothetical protein
MKKKKPAFAILTLLTSLTEFLVVLGISSILRYKLSISLQFSN